MEGVPRPRPPYLLKETSRHGKTAWYVRRGIGPRTRIRAEFGTPEFQKEYQAALAKDEPVIRKTRAASGSLQWLYDRYRETEAWTHLSPATRRQRENILAHVMEKAGADPFVWIERGDIEGGKDDRKSTPAQARNFLDAMRGLFRWAVATAHISVDPTLGVENPPRKAGPGFPAWDEEDVALYEAKWPIGTRQRVWLDVLLYTGLRRGDAVKFGRQHVRGGIGTIRTEKTNTEVTIPILPILAVTLKAGPCGDLSYICGERRQRLTKESFGNFFSEACREAGIRKSAHGVRKIAATRAAENGATVAQLEALFGWQGGTMAALYTRAADRKRLAIEAARMLTRTTREQSIPAPEMARPRTLKKH